MSSNARAERRRRERAHRKGPRRGHFNRDADYGVQAGWFASLDDLEEAKRLSHDLLIKQMGEARTGPVWWDWSEGDRAYEQLAAIAKGATGELSDHYRRIRAHLREYGGWLIVAMAEGRRP